MVEAAAKSRPTPRPAWRYRRAARGQPFRHGFRITLGGAAYIAICLFVGLAAVNSQINPLFLMFGIVLGGLIVSGMISTLTLAGLRATRRMPLSAMAGQVVLLLYQVTNRKRWLASYSLHVREHQPPANCSETYLPAVPGGATASQRAMLLCKRRGLYRFTALTAYTRFPFSLFIHFARFKDPDELVVFPAIGRLTNDALSLVLRSRGETQQPQPRRGGEEEFYGLREYRHGDNPRWIHWRRSARLGALVVREMSPATPRRLVVMVSAGAGDGTQALGGAAPRASPRGTEPGGPYDELLEKLLSLAATVIHDAIGQGFEVGLVLACPAGPAGQWRWFPAARGPHQWFEMMRALALFAGDRAEILERLPRECLRHLAGAHCLWLTRGLSAEEVARQARALAEWNIAVRPLRAEDARFERLMTLPPPQEALEAEISTRQA